MVVPVTVAVAMAPVHLLSLGRRVGGSSGVLRLLGRRRDMVVMVKARLILRRRRVVLDRSGLRAGVVMVVLIRRRRGLRLSRRTLIHIRVFTYRIGCMVMCRRVARRVVHCRSEGERNDPQTHDCDKKSRKRGSTEHNPILSFQGRWNEPAVYGAVDKPVNLGRPY
jgi:hypothetical protein